MSGTQEVNIEEQEEPKVVKEARRVAPNGPVGHKVENHAIREYSIREFKESELVHENGDYISDDQKMVCESILKIVDVLDSIAVYSNATEYVMNVVNRLHAFVPLSEVHDGDDQWVDIDHDPNIAQRHGRLQSLYKTHDGKIMFEHAIRWTTNDGRGCFGIAATKTGKVVASAQEIKGFPFEPFVILVLVELPETDNEEDSTIMPVIVNDLKLAEVSKNYNFASVVPD